MVLHYSICNLPAGGSIEEADEIRYFLILEGKGECSAKHLKFTLNVHDVAAVPPHIELSIKGEQPMLAGCIRVSDMQNLRPNIYHLPGEHTGLLRQLFYMALDIQSNDSPYFDAVRDAMNQLVFSLLIAAGLAADQLNPTVVGVIRKITDDFTNPDIDIRSLVAETGYTVNHFRKLFKDVVGIPPLEFLNNRRMDYAKELFRQWRGRRSVAEIAHACGFRDEYYFSRYFKKQTGMTPGNMFRASVNRKASDRQENR